MFANINQYLENPVLVSYKKSGDKYELTKVEGAISGYDDYKTDAKRVKSDKLQKLAVANPKLAPYGEAAHQAMEALGMKAALTPKIVEGDNIGKTYQFVATGNAQAGFVAMSQCAKDGKFTSGSGWVVPQELYKPITQDAVLLKAGEKNEGAKRFLEYLKTNKEADRIRFVYGYDTAK